MNQEELLKEFKEITDNMVAVAKAKNSDYSGEGTTDAFKNFKTIEFLGAASVEQGFVVRLTDKITRVANLLKQGNSVVDEKMEDTLLDMANYAVLFLIYRKSQG